MQGMYLFSVRGWQFLFDGIFNLSLTNVRFNSCGLNILISLSLPAIKIYNTVNAKFVNVSITHSRADGLSIRNSTVELTNILFQYNTAGSAGITIIDSTVSFEGENLFSKNLALLSNQKAVIYASNSHLTLDGSNQFLGNLAQYGAGLEAYNCSVVSTGALNFSNNFGDSTVYFETSLVSLNGEVHFSNNRILSLERLGTLGAVNSSLYLNGEMAFVNNYGSVHVQESSVFLNGSMTFSDNTVTDHMFGVLDFTDSDVKLIGEINFFNNFADSINSAGLFMSNSNVDIIGNCSFAGNSALFVSTFLALHKRFHMTGRLTVTENVLRKSSLLNAGVLATQFCSVFVNGSFDVCDNVASHANTVMFMIEGNMKANGNFTFTGNVGSGTCMNGKSIVYTLNGQTLFANNSGGYRPLFFQDSTVKLLGTTIFTKNLARNRGGGALTLVNSSLEMEGKYIFSGNRAPMDFGGAVYASLSTLIFVGNGEFVNNTAKNGGALTLIYKSAIELARGVSLRFEGNYATKGGAIYILDIVNYINCTKEEYLRIFSQPPPCFFHVSSSLNNISLTFRNNEATIGGTALYGGMLDMCVPQTPRSNQTALDIFRGISDMDEWTNQSVSSEPFMLCLCENRQPNCSLKAGLIRVKRGELITFSATALDQTKHSIAALVQSYLTSDSSDTNKELTGQLQTLEHGCTDLNFRVWSPNPFEQLVVYVDGPCRDIGNASHTFEIHFFDCPDWFSLQVGMCVCHQRLQKYTNSCNIDTEAIERLTNFWVGAVYDKNNSFDGLILYPNCPFDYCDWPSAEVVPLNTETQCNWNRSGMLCGSCRSNLSNVFGSSRCLSCSSYYLFLLVPFALVGIALVIVLLLLELTIATGMLHGLIFYANVVAVNYSIFIQPGTFKGLTVFLAWVNLDLGIESCFYDGMDQYTKTWLQFVFPVYLWILVAVIIVVGHYSAWVSKLLGHNPVAVLATIILLSYTMMLRNVLTVFSYATLEYPNDRYMKVWLYDGNLDYLQGKHAALFTFSFLVLIVLIVPYTLLLLLAQLLQKVSYFSCLLKVKPFIDAYQAPYKPAHRYWIGLCLLMRCVILITFTLNALGEPSINLLTISSVSLGLVSIFGIAGGIYTRRLIDVLEISFIVNLGMFSAATYHIRDTGGNQATVANISISISFFTFVGVLIALVYQRLKKVQSIQTLFKKVGSLKRSTNIMETRQEEVAQRNIDLEDSVSMETDRSKVSVQLVPSPHSKASKNFDYSVVLREPLLEDPL